ncbi:MAG: biotin-protein ligase [Chlamydiales bacterium]|jgi:biotin--protein ligase|nr:biotin-protein ligase [Chlamydiales bacterium]
MGKILPLLFMLIYTFAAQVVYASSKNTVYIYKDDGVSEESLGQTIFMLKDSSAGKYLVKTITAEEVQQDAWIEYAVLFVIPGGADLPYVRKLNGLGNQKIKQYVEEGGSFLGICAGAYYASSYVQFDKDGPLEVLGDRELSFFQGKAIGPILAPYDYKTHSSCRAAKISTIFSSVPQTVVYYNGGGFFENVESFSNTKVIATYENELPSIIAMTCGKGKVVLSGVHFEYNPLLLDSNDAYIQKILMPLIQFDASRRVLIEQLLQMLAVSE